jgi:signal transduction histidine kinase
MNPAAVTHEIEAAILLAVITLALTGLSTALYRRYHKPYFLWWAAGWGLYALRIGAIITFLETSDWRWLYLHQVITGWAALALLGAALHFAQPRRLDPRWIAPAALFPVAWAWVAIYQLESFTLAASATVALLALTTGWTGWTFLRYRRRTGSAAARLVGITFLLWGLHHLDYPILRARGLLTPWSYYLDIAFILVTGIGMLLLVMEDLQRGLRTLSALSGDLQRGAARDQALDAILVRPLALTGVRGSAMYLVQPQRFVRGVGIAAGWAGFAPRDGMAAAIHQSVTAGKPVFTAGGAPPDGDGAPFPFTAVLPVTRGAAVRGALVIVGSAGDPFTALDESFLVALGQQVGAALENEDLYQRLATRTLELERLSQRMIHQHEEQRRRLSLELHDETAQVFSAVKIQLGVLRESAAERDAARLAQVTALVDEGMKSIRRVTEDLRPSLLDDLGLVPALRALARDVEARTGLTVRFTAGVTRVPINEEGELALFRGLQEALSNVARHAEAGEVQVDLRLEGGTVVLTVEDDGKGLPDGFDLEALGRAGHMGLAGMHERMAVLGGQAALEPGGRGGVRLRLSLPAGKGDE